jgi:hypothetical protein
MFHWSANGRTLDKRVGEGREVMPKDSKHHQFMVRCLERAAKAASQDEREMLLAMARSFERCDIQLQKSLLMIADSRELLLRLDQGGHGEPSRFAKTDDAVSLPSREPSLPLRLSWRMTGTMPAFA